MRTIHCFVAMPFGRSDTDRLYDNVISKTVRSLGFTPIRVDRITHNDRVDFKIRSEIKKADILIADLTYARPSVYWEAGYAERAIPVVYMCRKDHFGKKPVADDPFENYTVHFDLANANIIPWSENSYVQASRTLKRRLQLVARPIARDRQVELDLLKQKSEFSAKSTIEKLRLVDEALLEQLSKLNYKYRTRDVLAVGKRKWDTQEVVGISTTEKIIDQFLFKLRILPCRPTLPQKLLNKVLIGKPQYDEFGILNLVFAIWKSFPPRITKLGRSQIKGVRNIWVLSSLSKVSSRTIEGVLTNFRRSEYSNMYYSSGLNLPVGYEKGRGYKRRDLIPTSCEIIFLDQLFSVQEVKKKLCEYIGNAEEQKNTLVSPK